MATLDDPSLSVIPPTKITDGMYTSSSLPENDYAPYNPATSYGQGAFCISTVTHRIYQSQIAANVDHDPTDPNNQFGPVMYWTDMGPTNKWAIYDEEANTQSVSPVGVDLVTVTTPGFFDSIFLGGLEADTSRIVVDDSVTGEILLDLTTQLEGSEPDDYWEWCYAPFEPQEDLLITGLTPSYNARVTTTLSSGVSGQSKVGIQVFGMIVTLGETQYGASASPKSYSSIKTDDFGRTKIKRRGSVVDMQANSELELKEADKVLKTCKKLLDVPAVWIGTNIPGYGGLRCFGLGSGKITYPKFNRAAFDLTVKALV